MAVSGFGVEHVCKADRDRTTAGLGLAATGAGTGALVAHKAQGDLRRYGPAMRVKGALHAIAAGDPAKLAHHIRGAGKDVKTFAALDYAKHGLGAAAVGLGGTAALTALSHRRKQ